MLDIEGTTSPISFVTDVLFPYARDNVRKHLHATYGTDETKDDIALLRAQVEQDLAEGVAGTVPIPPDEAGKDKVIDALVANVEAMIEADRKIASLKQLQGHIWRTGFEGQEIKGVVFEDVPPALEKWHASGIKVFVPLYIICDYTRSMLYTFEISIIQEALTSYHVIILATHASFFQTYIYSSGSREAQRLIFGNTTYGDLRKYLSGFFDTKVGYGILYNSCLRFINGLMHNHLVRIAHLFSFLLCRTKREAHSYHEIWQSVGVDRPSQILFLTDVYYEATAAKAAGNLITVSAMIFSGKFTCF